MQLKFAARALVLIATSAAVAACQQFSPDSNTRTLSFNHSVAESTNQLLLLNIIRDAQRTPTYFTRLGSNSAQSTFSPSLGLAFPFGVLSGGSAAIAAQGTTQNVLELGNLDDKKYQDGAMRRVDLETVQSFWNEGLQPDALGLLLIGSIQIPAGELPLFTRAVGRICGDAMRPVTNKYCGSAGAGDACFKDIPLIKRNGRDYALYINDPAWEFGVAHDHGPAQCFQVVLRDLLALGLHPTTRKSTEELDGDVPGTVLKDGRFRADMIKGGFEVGLNDTKSATHVTKISPETVFALDPGATFDIRSGEDYRKVLGCKHGQLPDTDRRTGKHLTLAKRNAVAEADSEPDDECNATLFAGDATKDHENGTVFSTSDIKIELSVRSFESVVYYLGEVVRAETANSDMSGVNRPYYPTIVGRAPWGEAAGPDEPLFVVRKGPTEGRAALGVTDDRGDHYWIPDFCSPIAAKFDEARARAEPGCGIEYPNHESMTVLTLVNQLWGLQKEPSTPPTPTINVGG